MRVRVVSELFAGKSRLERHRMINDLAAAELQGGLHALAIEAREPSEAMHGGRRTSNDADKARIEP